MSRPPHDDWSDAWGDEPSAEDSAAGGPDDAHDHQSEHAAEYDAELAPFDHEGFDDHVLGVGYDEHHDEGHYPVDEDHLDADEEASGAPLTRAARHARQSAAAGNRAAARGPREHRRRPFLGFAAVLAAIAVVVGGGYVAIQALDISVPSFSLPGSGSGSNEDYPGPGTGEVTVQIPSGAGGDQIGHILAEANVVASPGAFATVAAANADARAIQPGTYQMAEEMSAAGALERLLDPEFRSDAIVTFPEGLWQEEVFARLADATQYDVADYEAVDPADLNLPEEADGNLEGYLFPETYSFGPDETPEDHLQKMVDMAVQRHEALGLEGEDGQRALTIASIIQAEVNQPDDLPRVARVIENRLADDGRLEMDSTVHFVHKERGQAGTTDEQRGSDDPYNTYRVEGLPPGPINSPGDDAINAALNPAEGDWEFFVTINPDTGETVFSDTFEEHEEAVEDFQAWCRENTDRC